jgi:NAD(P)-dependent dehydrogenase (short-subunit alcohol dehydrogenase family)
MSNNSTKKLAGKVVFVTGGSRGIGAAIAITYSGGQQKADEVVRSIESAWSPTSRVLKLYSSPARV